MDNIKIVKDSVLEAVEETLDIEISLIQKDFKALENKTNEVSNKLSSLEASIKNTGLSLNDKLSSVTNSGNTFKDSLLKKEKEIASLKFEIEGIKSTPKEIAKDLSLNDIKGLPEALMEVSARPVSQPMTVDVYNGATLVKSGVTKINSSGATYANGVVTLGGSTAVVGTGVLTAQNYTTTFSPATTVVSGTEFTFIPDVNNPANATLNGVLIKEASGTTLNNLEANDMIGGGFYKIRYNGTNYILVGTSNASGIPAWLTATSYAIGDTVTNEGRIYRANTANTSTTFSADRANWTMIATIGAGTAWTATTYYYANDVVVQNNVLYKRIGNGTSGTTFDATEEAFWNVLSSTGTIAPWDALTYYEVGEIVTVNDVIYRTTIAHTSPATFTQTEQANFGAISNYVDIPLWIPTLVYPAGKIFRQTNGRIIRGTTSRTTGATFDVTEASFYEVVKETDLNPWTASTVYYPSEQVTYKGGIIKRSTLGTSGATFNSTEGANWINVTPGFDTWTASTYYYAGTRIDQGLGRIVSRTADGLSGTVFNLAEAGNYTLITGLWLTPWIANTVYYYGEEVMYQNGILRAGNTFTSAATFTFLESSNWVSMTPGSTDWLPNTIIFENTIVTGTYSDRVLQRNLTSLTPATFTLAEAGNYDVVKPVVRQIFNPATVYYRGEEILASTNSNIVYARKTSGESAIILDATELLQWTLIAGHPVTTISGNYTVVETDNIIECTGAGPYTITIPNGRINRELHFSRLHPNTLTAINIQTIGGETIVDPTTGTSSIATLLPGIANTNVFMDYFLVGTVWQAA